MKKIAVIGFGYVGQAFAKMVNSHYEVWVINPSEPAELPENVHYAGHQDNEEARTLANQCDLGVVCVPTESNEDGTCNTKIVQETVSWLDTPVILIKSTIAPGTTDHLKLAFNKRIVMSPEYVGEGKYYVTPRMDFQRDMKKTPFLILGGDDADCNYILNFLVPVLGPEKRYHKVAAIEAELTKYMENTYFGVKVTFAQEMYRICQKFGADWYQVWQGWSLDPRVDVMHTAVFPDALGFSGKCLPKDLNALVQASTNQGYQPTMLSAMIKSNAEVRENEPPRAKVLK